MNCVKESHMVINKSCQESYVEIYNSHKESLMKIYKACVNLCTVVLPEPPLRKFRSHPWNRADVPFTAPQASAWEIELLGAATRVEQNKSQTAGTVRNDSTSQETKEQDASWNICV